MRHSLGNFARSSRSFHRCPNYSVRKSRVRGCDQRFVPMSLDGSPGEYLAISRLIYCRSHNPNDRRLVVAMEETGKEGNVASSVRSARPPFLSWRAHIISHPVGGKKRRTHYLCFFALMGVGDGGLALHYIETRPPPPSLRSSPGLFAGLPAGLLPFLSLRLDIDPRRLSLSKDAFSLGNSPNRRVSSPRRRSPAENAGVTCANCSGKCDKRAPLFRCSVNPRLKARTNRLNGVP